MPLLKKPLRKEKGEVQTAESEQYIDLGTMYFPDESGATNGTIKVAELYRFEDVGPISQPIYNGNIMLIDYSQIANDQALLKRVTNELKNVARDTNGDVAAIGNNMIVVAPNGVRIDRAKMKGGFQ
ncbi:MAG: cell division protein SepF [Methanomassiliicoccales archaeon]